MGVEKLALGELPAPSLTSAEELVPPLVMCSGELILTLSEGGLCQRRPRLTNSVTTQAHIQGSELAHPNVFLKIYLILYNARVCVSVCGYMICECSI